MAQWGQTDPNTGRPRALISVELVPAAGKTLKTFVAKVTGTMKGTPTRQATVLGGTPAVRLNCRPVGPKPQPLYVVVGKRGMSFYMLSASATPGSNWLAAVEGIRTNWRWIPQASPDQHLALRPESVPLFRGHVTLKLPGIFRPYPVKRPSQVCLGCCDFRLGKNTYFANIDKLPVRPQGPTKAFLQGIAAKLKQRMRLPEDLTWRNCGGDGTRFITQQVDGASTAIPAPAGGRAGLWLQYGMLVPPRGEPIMMTFTTHHRPGNLAKPYADVAEKIVTSARFPVARPRPVLPVPR